MGYALFLLYLIAHDTSLYQGRCAHMTRPIYRAPLLLQAPLQPPESSIRTLLPVPSGIGFPVQPDTPHSIEGVRPCLSSSGSGITVACRTELFYRRVAHRRPLDCLAVGCVRVGLWGRMCAFHMINSLTR